MKPHIHVTVLRPDGRGSEADIDGDKASPLMFDAAEDLLHALTTGERLLPKDLYDACAMAFDTTREDAKLRLTRAMYGGRTPTTEPTLIGWTWRAHLNELHADVNNKRWIRVTKKLSLMLQHAVDSMMRQHADESA